MYRVRMDTSVRDDITAAAAVHRDLGPDYGDAVAEGLVERIGAEIDKRVDARLAQQRMAQHGLAPPGPKAPAAATRQAWAPVVMGLGSMSLGTILAVAVIKGGQQGGPAPAVVVVLIWALIAVVNVAYARHR